LCDKPPHQVHSQHSSRNNETEKPKLRIIL
jgi:hypothetical protein